jgi:hypothetical protein
MRLFNRDGEPSLWFALGECCNWHASTPSLFNPLKLPTSAYIRSAMRYFIERPERFREHFCGDIVHFCVFARDWQQMDTAERAQWHHVIYPRMVERDLGYSLHMIEDGYTRLRTPLDMRSRASRWHWRVRRAREAKRLTPAQIAALLEAAAALLPKHRLLGALMRSSDVLERILRHAEAAFVLTVRYI